MLSLEQLIFCLQKIYPGTRQGVDYWVAHPVDVALQQSAPAFIVEWKLDKPQPGDEQIDAQWTAHGAEFVALAADTDARAKRAALLTSADYLVETALDTGNGALESAARKYRQALRDVTESAGWPESIVWPDPPPVQSTAPQT